MKILINENQLSKLIKSYITTTYLNDIKKKYGPYDTIDLYKDGTKVMRYFMRWNILHVDEGFFFPLVNDVVTVFGTSFKHEFKEAVNEKFNIDAHKIEGALLSQD